MEASLGHFDEAWRHCDIAQGLLDVEPNVWVLGTCLNIRGGIKSWQCEFAKARNYFRRVAQLADECGSRRMRVGAELNQGFLDLVTGHYSSAEATLSTILENDPLERGIDASDFLARVHLAQGKLDDCERVLDGLNLYGDSFSYADYAERWTAVTKAKWLLKRGEFHRGLEWLTLVEQRSVRDTDRMFMAVVDLLLAQVYNRLGMDRECVRRLLRPGLTEIRRTSEFQGQFHYTLAMIARHESPYLAELLRRRATRIWSRQGVVSVRAEIDDRSASTHAVDTTSPRAPGERVAAAVNCISSLFDVGSHPHLMGAELVDLLRLVDCVPSAAVIETAHLPDEALNASDKRILLRLGDADRSGKTIVLTSAVPATPHRASVLADVLRIARAALALDAARREERNRAALWPSDPMHEQGDALFIAEEMQSVLDTARRVATTNIPVLITGETGTGKEVLARLIHSYSPRAAKTFLPFNCTATPREMLDAQLFGHRKGAFTGATENFAGVIRAASGGTLFLDEIGESTLDIQPKLLRFLESGEVHPIGETHPQRADVRVIAATNADVDALVAQGRFREDLFYRLNIVRLQIPPLRERRVEIPSFANHYLQKYAKEMNKGDLRLAEETMEYLVLYRWPGNVRQVANEMRRLAALAEPGAVLMPEHLSADIAASRRTVPASERPLDKNEMVVRLDQPLSAALQHVDRVMVEAAVAKSSSVDEAAKLLGLSRKGLYLKRLRYGMDIDRPKHASGVA
jgi:two-component system NtrC family response regulator/two-component system response regulator AtoC